MRSQPNPTAYTTDLMVRWGEGNRIRAASRRAGVAMLLVLPLGATLSPASVAEELEVAPASLSMLAPSDRGLRSDLAWLVDRNVLSLPLGTWPIPSSTLRAAWAGVDERKLDPADADALARVQRAVLRSTDAVRISARVNSGRHPSLDGGDTARGSASGQLSFYVGDEQWGGQLALDSTAQSLTPDGPQGSLDGSYLAVLLAGTVISAGVIDRWWGPGQFTSPILSTAARPIAGLIVRRAQDTAPETSWLHWVGQWGYELSAGGLAHYEPARTRTVGLRIYTRPWPNVELGLSRSILWAGEGRPHNGSTLVQALLGHSNIEDPAKQGDDPSDEVAGLDVRVSGADPWGGSWAGYLHLVGEDEAGGLPTKLFGTVGLQAKSVFGRQRFEASVEATDTMTSRLFGLGSPPLSTAYDHHIYLQGYYQGRLPLGANIGGGGRIYTLGLGWTPIDSPEQLRVYGTAFRGRVSETGPQLINAAFGVPGTLSGFSLGVDGESLGGVKWQIGVSMQRYPGLDRPQTSLQAGIDVPVYTGR